MRWCRCTNTPLPSLHFPLEAYWSSLQKTSLQDLGMLLAQRERPDLYTPLEERSSSQTTWPYLLAQTKDGHFLPKSWSVRPAQPGWRRSAWLGPTGSWLWTSKILAWLFPSFSSKQWDNSQLHLLQALEFCTKKLHLFSVLKVLLKVVWLLPSMFFYLLVWMYNISSPLISKGIA